jgi:hypothetical protein
MVRLCPDERTSGRSPQLSKAKQPDSIRLPRLVSPVGLGGMAIELTASCGYNVTDLAVSSKIGCTYRGWEWGIPERYFGFPLPDEINQSVSRVSVMA